MNTVNKLIVKKKILSGDITICDFCKVLYGSTPAEKYKRRVIIHIGYISKSQKIYATMYELRVILLYLVGLLMLIYLSLTALLRRAK